MNDKVALLTPPGINPQLTAALESWLNMRWERELKAARKEQVGRRVQSVSSDPAESPLAYGRTGTVVAIRMCLDDTHLYRLVVEADADGRELLVPANKVETTRTTRWQVKMKQHGLKTAEAGPPYVAEGTDFRVDKELPADPPRRDVDPKSRGHLTGKFVRVIDGVRLGYYLGLGSVYSHDEASDVVCVRMALDGKLINGFKAAELKVVME